MRAGAILGGGECGGGVGGWGGGGVGDFFSLHDFFCARCLCRNFFQVKPSARIFFSDK